MKGVQGMFGLHSGVYASSLLPKTNSFTGCLASGKLLQIFQGEVVTSSDNRVKGKIHNVFKLMDHR